MSFYLTAANLLRKGIYLVNLLFGKNIFKIDREENKGYSWISS